MLRATRTRPLAVAAVLLACAGCGYLPDLGLGGGAAAGRTTTAADVRAVATDPALTAARADALGRALAGRPGQGCDSVDGTELEKVEFPPERLQRTLAAGGVDRVWIERHRPPCRGPRVNLMAGFRPQAFATPLYPGDTLADPAMQADLRQPVRAAVEASFGARPPAGCAGGAAEDRVLDTRVASPPETRAATTTWRERWTVGLCGQSRSVDVLFSAREADGATTFRVVPTAAR